MSEASSGASPITIERKGNALVVCPQMKMMDHEAIKSLIRSVEEASGEEPRAPLVVLDLSRVATVPSMALGLLVHVLNGCRSREQRLVLAEVRPQVRQLFALTRLDQVFQFADSVEAAVQ